MELIDFHAILHMFSFKHMYITSIYFIYFKHIYIIEYNGGNCYES